LSLRQFAQPIFLQIITKSPNGHVLENSAVRISFLNLASNVFIDIAEGMEMIRSNPFRRFLLPKVPSVRDCQAVARSA
jgi:hypothetical protein